MQVKKHESFYYTMTPICMPIKKAVPTTASTLSAVVYADIMSTMSHPPADASGMIGVMFCADSVTISPNSENILT